MAKNQLFGSPIGLQDLKQVLCCYANRTQAEGAGYAQSMNFVAGLLRLVAGEPEPAFWLLAALVEDVLPAGFYSRHGLVGLQVRPPLL